MAKPDYHIFVCVQSRPEGHPRGSCGAKSTGALFDAFSQALIQRNLLGRVALTGTACLGPCQAGANVLIYPGAVMYSWVEPQEAAEIIEQHILSGELITDRLTPAELW
ncbi:2Fe-2S ferredoxin [Billgrantia endophytica]|uniref:Ferredoxin n=1 Tax=Billgrantia endophytica TaxID=2033802 RepID=A0A2N7U035_9GAMM|nr:2Fe-2S ferredoxin [Halomonas endophytica]PMR73795.1 ferredoxin [Halomonas endophytica]